MNTNRKSQVTIFMIVGLIIVIGGAIFFYSTKKVTQEFEPEIQIIQQQVPLEFDPIRQYATDCAYSVSVEGLKIIGQQGGYISFTNKALNKETFAIKQNPTESDAVYFTKDSDLKIPYWWYLKSANNCKGNCVFDTKRPDLRQTDNSIEKQLERYIDLKFKECVNNFEPFIEQGYKIIEAGKLRTDVTIASDDISVLVEYPITAEKQNTKSKISQFPVTIPINLDKVYELATKITNLEIKHHFIEKHVLNLLVAFSGVSREKLPPMSDVRFSFGSSMSWQKTDIKNKITAMLASYIPLFQVDGTYNYERNTFNSGLSQRLYDSTIIPVANSTFQNLAASFTYLDFWPAYFDLNCNGEICKPSSANSLISIIGLQTYRFAYDLSFPVLVEVQDTFALNGQGYTFNLFLEGNIRDNNYMNASFSPLEIADISESSQLCDVRTSGNVTIRLTDAAAKKPIDDAQVLYSVIGESCFIGSTDSDGTLKEQFPIGVGGVVNIVKDGYVGKGVEFDPEINTDASLKAELQPIYTKNIIVKKKNVVKALQGWQFEDKPVDLNKKEEATITLTRIGNENELEFSSVANYQGQQQEKTEIEIAPGDYSVDANLLLNERIIIPEKKKKVCAFLGLGCEEYAIPKVDFAESSSEGLAQFPEGGLKLNITINPDELQSHDKIVFYVVSIDIASVPESERVVEDLDQMGKIEEYSEIYQLVLQPEFK